MSRLFDSRIFGKSLDELPALLASAARKPFARTPESQGEAGEEPGESTLLLTFGWISAGLGAVAVGLFVGRELRQRYKFNRRTPYDFYAHSGDEVQDIEFGLGI